MPRQMKSSEMMLLVPTMMLAASAVLLSRPPTPALSQSAAASRLALAPARAIPMGRYLSVEQIKVKSMTQDDKRGYEEYDTKVEVTLLYSGPQPRKNIRFSIGGRTVNSPQESPFLVDSKGNRYQQDVILVSGAGAHEGQTMRRCTYDYYVNIKHVRTPGRVVLRHQVSADYSHAIPIWIEARPAKRA